MGVFYIFNLIKIFLLLLLTAFISSKFLSIWKFHLKMFAQI